MQQSCDAPTDLKQGHYNTIFCPVVWKFHQNNLLKFKCQGGYLGEQGRVLKLLID